MNGDQNPTNNCQVCLASSSMNQWSLNEGRQYQLYTAKLTSFYTDFPIQDTKCTFLKKNYIHSV